MLKLTSLFGVSSFGVCSKLVNSIEGVAVEARKQARGTAAPHRDRASQAAANPDTHVWCDTMKGATTVTQVVTGVCHAHK